MIDQKGVLVCSLREVVPIEGVHGEVVVRSNGHGEPRVPLSRGVFRRVVSSRLSILGLNVLANKGQDVLYPGRKDERPGFVILDRDALKVRDRRFGEFRHKP